jgi:DNA invertase Pin-like site-specific DNA recombinase
MMGKTREGKEVWEREKRKEATPMGLASKANRGRAPGNTPKTNAEISHYFMAAYSQCEE